MEIDVFYLYILASIVYLFWIQLRGWVVNKSEDQKAAEKKRGRSWKDPLDYYKSDISWFSISFIMSYLHMRALQRLPDDTKAITDGDQGRSYTAYGALLTARLFMTVFLPFGDKTDAKGKEDG